MTYTTEELQAMCRQYKQAKAVGDIRVVDFQMTIFMRTNIPPNRLDIAVDHMIRHGTWT